MAEYASNYLAFLQVARKTGATIEVIPNDAHGQISMAALRQAIDERVKLIAITHVPTNSGLVNPAAAVGEVARQAGVLYLLDACQSVGQMPMNVEAIGCDMLSTTGRKYLRGPALACSTCAAAFSTTRTAFCGSARRRVGGARSSSAPP